MKLFKEILFWFFIFIFYFSLGVGFSIPFGVFNVFSLGVGAFIIVKFNNNYLFDKYYYRLKYFKYMILVVFFALLLSFIFCVIETFLKVHPVHYKKILEHKNIFRLMILPFVFFFINYIVVFFLSSYLKLSKEQNIANLKIQELNKIQVETELKFLKTQINPHFLFNALNNIYSICYKEGGQASYKILELSDMLRYVLYDCRSDKVCLREEIEYLNNFVSFQKLKTLKKQNIIIDIDNNVLDCKIAPMILIPFVENCFKHSRIDSDPQAYVYLNIYTNNNELIIDIENSIPDKAPAKMLSQNNGIGLENVKKRINLIYGERANLKILNYNKIFSVNIKIQINE